MSDIKLVPLSTEDRKQFILDNQEAFNFSALEEFGHRDDHFEEDEQIISRETIEASIDDGEAYRIVQDSKSVGGVVIKVDGKSGDLDLLFVSPPCAQQGDRICRMVRGGETASGGCCLGDRHTRTLGQVTSTSK